MPERDLRGFIDLLSDHGEFRVVDGADWDLEIGTISELNYERQGPLCCSTTSRAIRAATEW